MVDICNKLCSYYDITIFTIYSKGELENQLDKRVKLKSLYEKNYSELTNFERITIPLKILLNKRNIYLKCIKEDYDTEIAFLEGPITRLFSVKNENSKKIAWVHNDISKVFGNGLVSRIKGVIDKKIYTKYETLVFVSKENYEDFKNKYSDSRNKKLRKVTKKIIYNYIDSEKIIKKSLENTAMEFNNEKVNFITVARLTKQKAIDRIINVHKKLIQENIDHEFYVIGDGPEKELLTQKIKDCNVANTFHLMGKKENPYPYIKQSDYFCLLSKFEGYGMVLEEAKILKKYIIITKTAAIEAIKDYDKSIIVENSEDGIYKGLKELAIKGKQKNTNESSIYINEYIIDDIKKIIGE